MFSIVSLDNTESLKYIVRLVYKRRELEIEPLYKEIQPKPCRSLGTKIVVHKYAISKWK